MPFYEDSGRCPEILNYTLLNEYTIKDSFSCAKEFEEFDSNLIIEKIKKYLNKQHKNIALTSEMEQNSSLSLPDIKISREKNNLNFDRQLEL